MRESPPLARLQARADRSGGEGVCWPWKGRLNMGGYGYLHSKKKKLLTHRLAYEAAFGPIPAGLLVRHRCDNKACVNPAHLDVGTHQDNCDDRMQRGRDGAAKRSGELNGLSKLTSEQVLSIVTDPRPSRHIARAYGVGPTSIQAIKNGQTWCRVTGLRAIDLVGG